MFFRRQPEPEYTFSQRLSMLREGGFTAEEKAANQAVVRRGDYAALIQISEEGGPRLLRAGLVIHQELAVLVSRGYQTFWRTPSGKEIAATAAQLEGLHGFTEDLRELLGLTSLYNESLGTTDAIHEYDRLSGRE